MDKEKIEKDLYRLRDSIPVNKDLKIKLREEFKNTRKSIFKKKIIALGGIAAAMLIAFSIYMLMPPGLFQRVSAASLRISNYISFLELGSGQQLGVSEYNGNVYMPISGKGLFLYDKTGYHKLLDKEVSHIRISNDGKKLAFSSDGDINILDLSTNHEENIKKGDKNTIYYEEPSWTSDNNHIIYTKRTIIPRETHGFDYKDEIYQISLNDGNSMKLADGSYAGIIKNSNAVIFEREGKVIYKSLSDGSEKVIDDGRFPSISPDGNYISYIKTQLTKNEVRKNIFVEENIDNIWIADTFNTNVKKQISSNFPNYYTSVEQWAKGLKDTTIPQVMTVTGEYSYYEPVWGSNSMSIYALKNSNVTENPSNMKLIKIDLTQEKLSAADIVKKFVQALVLRDDDFARSFIKLPPEILTISNPHVVGYKIIGRGVENEKEYVDAELYLSYTGDAFYQIVNNRYYLSTADNGYVIDDIKQLSTTQLCIKNGIAYLDEKEIFKTNVLLENLAAQDNARISSLAYSHFNKTLVLAVQFMKTDKNEPRVEVIAYNFNDNKFKKIDTINLLNGNIDIGIYGIALDSQGKNAAVDIYTQGKNGFVNYTNIYSLIDNKKSDIKSYFKNSDIESTKTDYWDEDKLVFSAVSHGETMRYVIKADLSLDKIS